LLNFKSGALRRLSGWAPFSFPLISEAGRERRRLAGFTEEVSLAVWRREHAGKMPALRLWQHSAFRSYLINVARE
jgi:hypothetical protein